jgi:isocitrate dehydrogenase
MLESADHAKVMIVGVDMFIESNLQPTDAAEKCLHHTGYLFKIGNHQQPGNAGVAELPSFTNLVNQYGCRFESVEGAAVTQVDVLELDRRLMQDFKICSSERSNQFGDKKAYSLAQGPQPCLFLLLKSCQQPFFKQGWGS